MVTCYFRPGEPLTILRGDIQIPIQGISSRHQVLLYPEGRPLRSKTYAANDTVELYCPWCESLPLTPAALADGNPTERAINFNYHDFLVVWNKMTETTKLGNFIQPLMRGRWKSDSSVLRYEHWARLHQSFHRLPAAYQAYALRCENVLHRVISGSTPIAGLQLPHVR